METKATTVFQSIIILTYGTIREKKETDENSKKKKSFLPSCSFGCTHTHKKEGEL